MVDSIHKNTGLEKGPLLDKGWKNKGSATLSKNIGGLEKGNVFNNVRTVSLGGEDEV